MEILIIGGDAAGMSAASQIKRRRREWNVTVLEKGTHTSYAACGIPYYFAGDVERLSDLVVVSPEEFREKRGIDARTDREATAIDIERRSVTARSADGEEETFAYDRLLIATGASPIIPAWPGVNLAGIVPLRNLDHAGRLASILEGRSRRAIIVGGGYIGLEMAEALGRRGLEVVVVEKLRGVMGGTESRITEMVRDEMARHGIGIRLETAVEGFAAEDGRLTAVVTDRGPMEADVAILALGVRPNTALAAKAGIVLGQTGAIRVDPRQRTRTPDIWAAGDCAEAHHLVLDRPAYIPLALTANRQGRVAGADMAGGEDRFPGIVGSAVTRIYDLTLARTGIDEATASAEAIPYLTVEAEAPSKAHYFPGHEPLWIKLVFHAENHRLLGAWLVGRDPSAGKRADILATAISARMTVQQVADLDLSYAPPFAPVWDPVLQAANRARLQLQGS